MTSDRRQDRPPLTEDAFDAVRRQHPLLDALAAETARGGLTNTTSAAMAATELPHEVVEPFLLAAVPHATPSGLAGLGELALLLVDRCGYGHRAAETAVARPDMPDSGHLLMHRVAVDLRRPEDVQWWHDVFAQRVRRDGMYYSFLSAHAEELLQHRSAEVARYLLEPDRGPAPRNVDALLLVICRGAHAEIFVRRWVDWLWDGRFDDRRVSGNESPQLHYACIVDGLREAPVPVGEVLDQTLLRVGACLHSTDPRWFDVGCQHLLAMLDRAVPFARRVSADLLREVPWTRGPRPAATFGLVVGAAFEQLAREAGTSPGQPSRNLDSLTGRARAELERLIGT